MNMFKWLYSGEYLKIHQQQMMIQKPPKMNDKWQKSY